MRVVVLALFVVAAALAAGAERKGLAPAASAPQARDQHMADIEKAEAELSNAAERDNVEATEESVVSENPQQLEEAATTSALDQRFFLPVPHLPMLQHPAVQHLTGRRVEPEGASHSIVLSPSFGPTSGGIWVQVMGAGSYHTPNSLQCKLDLVEQFCYSNHYYYSWCYITPKCAGVYPFRCHNGPLHFEGKFAVVAKTPWVTSVYPFSGDTSGGTPVTVRGWNFEPHCPQHLLCKFGEQIVPAKYYTSSSIMCIAPCADQKGFVSVEVSNDGGMHWSMSGVQYGFVGEPADLTADECQRYLSPFASNPKH